MCTYYLALLTTITTSLLRCFVTIFKNILWCLLSVFKSIATHITSKISLGFTSLFDSAWKYSLHALCLYLDLLDNIGDNVPVLNRTSLYTIEECFELSMTFIYHTLCFISLLWDTYVKSTKSMLGLMFIISLGTWFFIWTSIPCIFCILRRILTNVRIFSF